MNIPALSAWLIRNGAIILEPTNPYEALRFQTSQDLGIIHRNGRGMISSISATAKPIIDAFHAGKDLRLSPTRSSRRSMSRETLEHLSLRDGWNCFYCSELLTPETATGEHLCPKAHGGPNHPSNMVLSCEPCNQDAGNLPIIEKLKLRGRKKHGPRRKVRANSAKGQREPVQMQDELERPEASSD